MPRQKKRNKARCKVSSGVRNSGSAMTVEAVDSDDAQCEIVFEDTPKSTLRPRKSSVVKRTWKSKKLYNDKCTTRVSCTPVIGMPSTEVIVDREGCIVVDESSLGTGRSAEPETHVDHGKKNKHKTRPWTLEDTKRFYASLGSVQTDFSLMACLFNNSRSRAELKRKFKLEEKRNKDLIDKALTGRVCNVSALLNDPYSSGSSVDQNSTANEINKTTSIGNTRTVQNVSEVDKPQAKCTRRVRKFYFASDSDEEDMQGTSTKRSSQAGSLSSQPPLSNPAEISPLEFVTVVYQLGEPDSPPESATCASDNNFTSVNRLNIRHPTVVRTGENGKRQASDAHDALNTEDEVVVLANPKEVPQTRSSYGVFPQEISNGIQKTRLRPRKLIAYYEEHTNTLSDRSSSQNVKWAASATTRQKVSQRKPRFKVHCKHDVVKLLLGHLKDVDVGKTGNEVVVLQESECNVLKIQRKNSKPKKGMSSEIHSEDPDVEVVFEDVPFIS